ncbi:hypothetical protein MCOR02_009928 [Pyricularia oryzae]|nr:hypothetical protein MCOR02_009928 [Pyricularia oryzae]
MGNDYHPSSRIKIMDLFNPESSPVTNRLPAKDVTYTNKDLLWRTRLNLMADVVQELERKVARLQAQSAGRANITLVQDLRRDVANVTSTFKDTVAALDKIRQGLEELEKQTQHQVEEDQMAMGGDNSEGMYDDIYIEGTQTIDEVQDSYNNGLA